MGRRMVALCMGMIYAKSAYDNIRKNRYIVCVGTLCDKVLKLSQPRLVVCAARVIVHMQH